VYSARLVTSHFNLYKGISRVKVIDFLTPIKIDWQKICLSSYKEFFANRFPLEAVRDIGRGR
jgi:hypothetical protein